MKLPHIFFSVVLLSGFGMVSGAAAQILNGTFSANASSFTSSGNGRIGNQTPGTTITDWTSFNTGGNSDYGINGPDTNPGGTPVTAFGPSNQTGITGDYYFNISPGPTTGPTDASNIYQSISLTANTTYQLTYAFSTRAGNSGQGTIIIFNGASTGSTNAFPTTSLVSDTETGSAAAFVFYSDTFTTPATLASSQTILLENSGVTTGNTISYIDYTDISLTVVPEPSTYVVLGAGTLALLLINRRRLA